MVHTDIMMRTLQVLFSFLFPYLRQFNVLIATRSTHHPGVVSQLCVGVLLVRGRGNAQVLEEGRGSGVSAVFLTSFPRGQPLFPRRHPLALLVAGRGLRLWLLHLVLSHHGYTDVGKYE